MLSFIGGYRNPLFIFALHEIAVFAEETQIRIKILFQTSVFHVAF